MRKRVVSCLLTGSLLLGGCSGYYRKGADTVKDGPEIVPVETTEAESSGPEAADPQQPIAPLETPASTEEKIPSDSIFIASDIHYLAKELTDFGPAFESMVNGGDGKLVSYVWEITDAFLNEVIEQMPKVLILSGDLTLEGERLSHEALADQLEKVEDAGIPVVVIPGNHDINNGAAAMYRGSQKAPAEMTTPQQFAEIYGEFGYDEAVSQDTASLSYVYELNDGTWLLMLDSCQYEESNQVGGMIRNETYDWIDDVLGQAWNEGREVITVAHHNLFDESRIYENDYTIEHSEELERKLGDWGAGLFLSGHLHVQHYKTSEEYMLDEIVTASLSTSPFVYGVLNYENASSFEYHTEQVNVSEWAFLHSSPDSNLQSFETYADEFLQEVFYNKAFDSLQNESVSEEERQDMAALYALLNVYAVAGHAYEIRDMVVEMPGYEQWQELSRTNVRAMYLNEILEDAVVNYNVLKRPGDS